MNSWLCLQVVSVKYVTVPGSSHMEFSLLAVKATWFHLPGTPLFIVVFWFVPNGRGVLRRYLSESIHSDGGLRLERLKSESSPKKRFAGKYFVIIVICFGPLCLFIFLFPSVCFSSCFFYFIFTLIILPCQPYFGLIKCPLTPATPSTPESYFHRAQPLIYTPTYNTHTY